MYSSTRNDLDTFLAMDAFWRPDTPLTALTEVLKSDNWQVQQAVCTAIGDRGEAEALPAIADLLDAQDALGVYACPDEWDFDAAGSESERETWRCRFRVKQAALLAIGGCVARHGAGVVSDALREHIERYAVSQDEDYPVRAAACDLLGAIGHPASRPILERAATDGEWCTATAASKALAE
jgi:HEAT repeat protein